MGRRTKRERERMRKEETWTGDLKAGPGGQRGQIDRQQMTKKRRRN